VRKGGSRWASSRPGFWPARVGVGLPIWLHLLKKHKTTPLPFSSLMFLTEAAGIQKLHQAPAAALPGAVGAAGWR